MRISRIRIENFRSLREFQLEPTDGVNLLVGENNAGKSAVLVALSNALGRGTPDLDLEDFYVTTATPDPAALPAIVIDLDIRPPEGATLSTNFTTEFVDDVVFDGTGSPLVTFRTRAQYDNLEERIVIEYFSVRGDGSARPMSSAKRFALRGYVPFYLVDAFRDTIRDIQSRRGFWGRIVNSITLDATTVQSIEGSIKAINQSILNAAPRIGEIESRLREIGSAIQTATPPNDIVINPITVDPSGILRNLDVILRTASAPRGFGLARHGEGTRSVAHLAIFRAFIDLLAKEENDNLEATPILGIEEPEVHLHPHAIRALGAMLSTPPRQMLLTTHSPELARSVNLTSIQVLRREALGTVRKAVPESTASGPLLDQRDQVKLDRALDSGAIEILFSRAAILCEGPSELQAYPFFASALGIDLDKHSISLVPVDGSYFYHLLRIMAGDALQIPWVLSADGDSLSKLADQLVDLGRVTKSQVQAAESSGNMESAILRPNDFFTLPSGYNLEEALIRGGAAAEYETAIVDHIGPNALSGFAARSGIAGNPLEDQLVAFMKSDARTAGKRWKVLFAGIVADKMTGGGTNPARIPATISDALNLAMHYSTGTAVKAF
jgi:putative ATP-dependent endonuclease of OLD family